MNQAITRRNFNAAAALAAAGFSAIAPAQTAWPSKPINCVVGFAPGGGTDFVMRTIGPGLSAQLGQPFVVDNRPGASGIVAAQLVAQSKPDGYTVLGMDGSALALNAALYSKLPYDPIKDFAPVSLVIRAALLLVAHPAFPANDLRGAIEIARRDKKLDYASPGQGTYHHLLMELFKRQANFDAVAVPYKGTGAALLDVVAGQVPTGLLGLVPAVLQQVRAGKLKVLAAFTAARVAALPDVRTAAEQGFPDLDVYAWVGVAVPRETPTLIVNRLSNEIRSVVATPEVVKKFQDASMESFATSPEELAAFIDRDIKRFHPLIRSLKLRLD
jgi:tripartite-type tricarboxylate transporter receptor subunit TctC